MFFFHLGLDSNRGFSFKHCRWFVERGRENEERGEGEVYGCPRI
jgi:hypothetical protein